MKKIKSTEEMLKSAYLTKAEVRRMFHLTYGEALHIFNLALDREKDKPTWYVGQRKARTDIVLNLMDMTEDDVVRKEKAAESLSQPKKQ